MNHREMPIVDSTNILIIFLIKSPMMAIESLPIHYILELNYEWTDSIGNKYIEIYIVELFG